MNLSATRIRPGVYELTTVRGIEVNIAKVGSLWLVDDRDNVYSRDGFATKRAAMEHIAQVDAEHQRELEQKQAEREELWASMTSAHVWIDVGRVGPVELAEIIGAILPEVNTAAWIASARGPTGHATLLTWRGELDDIDMDQLDAHGGAIVGTGLAVPDGYREVA